MVIIGCDLHTRHRQIALLEVEAGEITTQRLEHEKGEASVAQTCLPRSAALRVFR